MARTAVDPLEAYQVWRGGQQLMRGPVECRYSPLVELGMLEAGYEIRVNGRKLTKKEVKGHGKTDSRG